MPVQYIMNYVNPEAWKRWKKLPDKEKKALKMKLKKIIYRTLGVKEKK